VRYNRIDRLIRHKDFIDLFYYADQEEELLEVKTFKVSTQRHSTSTPTCSRTCTRQWN
jgi:hypothetical protein